MKADDLWKQIKKEKSETDFNCIVELLKKNYGEICVRGESDLGDYIIKHQDELIELGYKIKIFKSKHDMSPWPFGLFPDPFEFTDIQLSVR